MSADVVKTLNKARRLLIEAGWCQRSYHSKDGRHCMIGAIAMACGTRDPYASVVDEPFGFLTDALPDDGGERNHRVTIFNDAPDRTKEQVLEVFDRAIVLALQKSVP